MKHHEFPSLEHLDIHLRSQAWSSERPFLKKGRLFYQKTLDMTKDLALLIGSAAQLKPCTIDFGSITQLDFGERFTNLFEAMPKDCLHVNHAATTELLIDQASTGTSGNGRRRIGPITSIVDNEGIGSAATYDTNVMEPNMVLYDFVINVKIADV
jgi:hypothetical protein